MVTWEMFLCVSREFHFRQSSIDITLLVLWNLPVVYLAALRGTFSISLFCFLVCGDQMVEQYSRFDLTKDLYSMLLVCSFFIWRFLLKNPNNFCAFDVMLFTCAFQVHMLDETVIPRYFAVSTDSRVCPFRMQLTQLYLKGVFDRLTDIELHCFLQWSSKVEVHCRI